MDRPLTDAEMSLAHCGGSAEYVQCWPDIAKLQPIANRPLLPGMTRAALAAAGMEVAQQLVALYDERKGMTDPAQLAYNTLSIERAVQCLREITARYEVAR